jgi:hypothetical protein
MKPDVSDDYTLGIEGDHEVEEQDRQSRREANEIEEKNTVMLLEFLSHYWGPAEDRIAASDYQSRMVQLDDVNESREHSDVNHAHTLNPSDDCYIRSDGRKKS